MADTSPYLKAAVPEAAIAEEIAKPKKPKKRPSGTKEPFEVVPSLFKAIIIILIFSFVIYPNVNIFSLIGAGLAILSLILLVGFLFSNQLFSEDIRNLFRFIGIFILIAIGLAWAVIFNMNATGQYLSAESGTFSADIKESFRELSPELNMFKSIMLGEYDPNALWTSKEYQDRYATVKDAGVSLESIKPLREFFLPPEQDIVIIGNIKVVSLPGEDIAMRLSAKTPEIGISTELAPLAGEDWDCQPSTLSESTAYLGRFTCSHDTQDVELFGEYASGTVNIDLAYDFDSKSGFQVFIANYNDIINAISEGKNLPDFYGITKAQLTSWETQGPVGLGMGVLGEGSILAANIDELNEVPHFLGVTVRNDAPGTLILKDADLYLTLPCSIDVDLSESDFRLQEINDDLGVELCKYKNTGGLGEELKPGMHENFYLKFYAWDQDKPCSQDTGNCNFLSRSPISSFFILGELQDYTYLETKSTAFRLKKSPGQP
jgi:hypothetical protein